MLTHKLCGLRPTMLHVRVNLIDKKYLSNYNNIFVFGTNDIEKTSVCVIINLDSIKQ